MTKNYLEFLTSDHKISYSKAATDEIEKENAGWYFIRNLSFGIIGVQLGVLTCYLPNVAVTGSFDRLC